MAKFMIMVSNPPDMYLDTLDRMSEVPHVLSKTYWGMMGGDFTGWVVLEAESEEAARKMLPCDMRSEAHVAEIKKYSQDDIVDLHEELAA